MDELSPGAKALLKLAKREHEVPNEQVAGRVRSKVAAAVLLTDPTLLGTAKAKVGGALTQGALAKLGAGVLAVSLAGGGALLLRTPTPTHPARAPAGEPRLSAPAAGGTLRQPSAPASSAQAPATHAEEQGASTLQAELSLLERASELLARGDLEACLNVLAEHRQRFPRALLVEERDGLELLARCRTAPSQARSEAQAFVAAHPGAMLNVRIRAACLGAPSDSSLARPGTRLDGRASRKPESP